VQATGVFNKVWDLGDNSMPMLSTCQVNGCHAVSDLAAHLGQPRSISGPDARSAACELALHVRAGHRVSDTVCRIHGCLRLYALQLMVDGQRSRALVVM
jgi:hypothetical protein